MLNTPIACDMTALNSEQRDRHGVLSSQLAQRVEAVEELADGYAFRYRADGGADASLWITVAEYVDLERRCCPFFKFTLEKSPASDSVRLCLTGGEGVKEFLKTQIQQNA